MVVNIFLFDDFETMDAFGPAQVFGELPEHFLIRYLSGNGGIVNSSQGVKVWTEELNPEEIRDILLVPGGKGAKKLIQLEPEMTETMKAAVQAADVCMLVSNGSALLAQTGVLYRRTIADYSFDENWKRMFTAGINRVREIRWAVDGKFYSSSSSMAGIDMALGVVADLVDIDEAERAAKKMGYDWDSENEEAVLR
jgi:transcriptional regulator GlxA family with amidase domain